jgi:coenzyme F420-0:L-glutamate ligase / coenzyme F420-1:gamma-L-glutamate ligase
VEILPIRTPILREGDDLAAILMENATLNDKDILVISSKAIATVEGATIDLTTVTPTEEARAWSERCGRSPEFRQAILDEATRLHGTVAGSCPLAMLTELKPDGLAEGTLLVPNAGLDQSNIPEGQCIGWPVDPVRSVRALRHTLMQQSGLQLALILSDSCCRPRRRGVTAFALVVSGMDPFFSLIGKKDLYRRALAMTVEARADQLATSANMVMGNAGESTPAAIIRDHGFPLSDCEGWVPGIPREEDLFGGAS